jgi:hypothetical protein
LKICSKCKEERPRELFSKRANSSDGLVSQCNICKKIKRGENAEIISAKKKEKYRSIHGVREKRPKWKRPPDKVKQSCQNYRANNSDKIKAYSKKYYEEHKLQINEKCKNYYKEHKTQMDYRYKLYYQENKDKMKERSLIYRVTNPHIFTFAYAKRRSTKLQATPSWVDEDAVRQIYKQRSSKCDETGIIYHVDHIVPLSSRYVCGLHWEQNLQIITAKENMSKGNRWWPDMP